MALFLKCLHYLSFQLQNNERIIIQGGESGSESDGDDSGSEDSVSEGGARDRGVERSGAGAGAVNSEEEDEDQEWAKFQNKVNKREKALEGKSRISHSVHCPYYTDDKQEYW